MSHLMLDGPQLNPDKSFFQKLINSGITTFTLSFTCNNCGNKWTDSFGPLSIFKFLLMGTRCPNCGKKNYVYEFVGTLLSIGIGLYLAFNYL